MGSKINNVFLQRFNNLLNLFSDVVVTFTITHSYWRENTFKNQVTEM